jgi:hypothetical protein
MSKKSKRNRKNIEIKSANIGSIVSLIAIMLDGVVQRAFQWMSRLTGKEEGGTALPKSEEAENKATGVSGSAWIFGCSAGAAGKIAGTYYEEQGSNFNNNPLVASVKGVDGKTTFGSIDEYWDVYNSTETDPYEGSGSGKAAPL